jgi:hypothetical protein
VCQPLGLPLLLMRRPESTGGLPMPALLEMLGHP